MGFRWFVTVQILIRLSVFFLNLKLQQIDSRFSYATLNGVQANIDVNLLKILQPEGQQRNGSSSDLWLKDQNNPSFVRIFFFSQVVGGSMEPDMIKFARSCDSRLL